MIACCCIFYFLAITVNTLLVCRKDFAPCQHRYRYLDPLDVVNLQIPLTGYGGISQLELEGMNKGQSGNFWASIGRPKVGQNNVVEVNVTNTGDRAVFVKALPFKGILISRLCSCM